MASARLHSSDPTNHSWTCACNSPSEIIRGDDVLNLLARIEQPLNDGERWIGYLAYNAAGIFEPATPRAIDDLHLPLAAFMRCGCSKINSISIDSQPRQSSAPRSNFTREKYLAAVNRAIDYIAAGDVFQVNLSQRFESPLPCDPQQIYAQLLAESPAFYGAFLDFDDFQIISNSPELFLRVEPLPNGKRRVITRPIKGTRSRDAGMEIALRDSVKDQAELNMIIDLMRNDLGRVCEIGSVIVSQPRAIETHPTVFHGVATIEGILRSDISLTDLLAATFPGGSVTGAPKIRAMQIIDELEPVQRSVYCGAIGWIDARGAIELSIAIRTMIVKNKTVYIPVGGGIVADSDPENEYEETLVKARAMFAALGINF